MVFTKLFCKLQEIFSNFEKRRLFAVSEDSSRNINLERLDKAEKAIYEMLIAKRTALSNQEQSVIELLYRKMDKDREVTQASNIVLQGYLDFLFFKATTVPANQVASPFTDK